jgi:hypothetical protein
LAQEKSLFSTAVSAENQRDMTKTSSKMTERAPLTNERMVRRHQCDRRATSLIT